MVGCAFSKDLQGLITVGYQLDGEPCQSLLQGSFSEFQEEKRVSILVNVNSPTQSYWNSPFRFWLEEILLFIIWCLIVLGCMNWLSPSFYPYRRISAGITIITLSVLLFIGVRPYYQSTEDYRAVASPVVAKVESVRKDLCARGDSDDEFHAYPCYKPTYAYTVAQETYRFEAFEPYSRRPAIGKERELWYWKEDPNVVRDFGSEPPPYEGVMMIIFNSAIFLLGIYILFFHRMSDGS